MTGNKKSDQQTRRENERLARQNHRLRALNEVSIAISGAHDFDAILQIAGERLQTILPFDRLSVALVDEEAQVVTVYDVISQGETRVPQGYEFSLEDRGLGHVERTGEPLIIQDLKDADDEFGPGYDLLAEDGLRSILSVPLQHGDALQGSLNIASQRAHAYDEEDETLLQQFADHLATVLETARLLEESRRREQQAEALYQASQLVSRVGGSLEEGMQDFFESLSELGDFDRWWVPLLDESGLALRGAAGYWEGLTDEDISRRIMLSEERKNPVVIAFLNQETVIVNDPEQDERLSDLPSDHRRSLGKYVSEPLISRGQSIGVVSIGHPVTGEDISEDDVELVRALAGQISLAVENTRLFEDARRATDLLAERVQALDCLNEVGQKIDEAPPLPEFLEWVTGRIPAVMEYPEHSVVAIAFDGQIYGDPRAIELPCQVVRGLSVGGERVGRLYVAYTEPCEFRDQESALLGDIVRRVSSYIENQRLLHQAEARVGRERALRQIVERVQGLTNPEAVARAAVKELGTTLGRPTFIHVHGPQGPSSAPPDNGEGQEEASREGGR